MSEFLIMMPRAGGEMRARLRQSLAARFPDHAFRFVRQERGKPIVMPAVGKVGDGDAPEGLLLSIQETLNELGGEA